MSETLEAWLRQQHVQAARYLQLAISPTALSKSRSGFAATVRGARGAVVASPVLADYDPEPDYFFHWYRDSALVMSALHTLMVREAVARDATLSTFADFLHFSLALLQLDGTVLSRARGWRERVRETHRQFLRSDEELAAVSGEAVSAEARVNADGTLDISRWARPQHDGPPLRLLCALRWWPLATEALREPLAALIHADLAFTQARAALPSYDIWEEELGEHYYNLRLSAAALRQAATWLRAQGQPQMAGACEALAAPLLRRLEAFFLAEADGGGYCRSRLLADGSLSPKALDVSVILAAIHSGEYSGAHTPADPRLQLTLDRLEKVFAQLLPINRHRGAGLRPALGRYPGDVYYEGGAWYLATLAAAEFCFVATLSAKPAEREAWRQRGDEYLATVRAYTPDSGALSEQFDRETGEPRSARHLAWSYAAFIFCVQARDALLREAA